MSEQPRLQSIVPPPPVLRSHEEAAVERGLDYKAAKAVLHALDYYEHRARLADDASDAHAALEHAAAELLTTRPDLVGKGEDPTQRARKIILHVARGDDRVAVETTVGGITFIDLDAIDEAAPEVLVPGLLYAEGIHLLSGHPAAGKSSFTAAEAHEVMKQGRHVVWFDWEAGPKQAKRRLREVGIPADLLRTFFHYAPWPPDPSREMAAIAARWPGALVVMDSLSKALAAAGINENANEEVTRWMVAVVQACKTHGLPTVLLDHVPKDSKGASDYSRGAGAKLADCDVHHYVDKTSDFNRTKIGELSVNLKKDREGVLPFKTYWTIGDGEGGLPIVQAFKPEDGRVETNVSEHEQILCAVKKCPAGVSVDSVAAEIGQTSPTARRRLNEMLALGMLTRRKVGKSFLYFAPASDEAAA